MGFNRRKMEDRRRDAAEKEAAARRATDAQVLEDAGRLIAAWNERQAKRMPMIFSPTIRVDRPASRAADPQEPIAGGDCGADRQATQISNRSFFATSCL
jgi:hypothetical protein